MKLLSSPCFCLLAALLLLPFAVSNDSLWLDEGDTAMYALEPNFSAWRERLLHDGQADCQMPLAMFCSWAAGKIIGTQEWQLRAVNLLWGALALVALSRVGRRLSMPWLPLVLAIQPYFWFYLNEARPYALQLGCGAWLLAALVEFYFARATGTGWAWQFAGATFFLFCATLLAPLTVAATLLAMFFFAWREKWLPSRKAIFVVLAGFIACVPVAAYYVTTLLRGAKGAQMWHVDLKFISYVVYELTGMGGIGLSPLEIRSLARSPELTHELLTRLPQLVLPLLLAALLAAVFIVGLRRWSRSVQPATLLWGILLVIAVTGGVFIIGSLAMQKAFWARHYAPVFPFYVALLGLALAGMVSGQARWWRCLPVVLMALLLWSALNFRFAPSLRKEDYRSAAAFVRPLLAQNQSVWWVAGGYSANYYGLTMADTNPGPGKVFSPFLARLDVRMLPLPDVIVLSKPDIHDANGAVQKIISENPYRIAARYQSFVIWTNSAGR